MIMSMILIPISESGYHSRISQIAGYHRIAAGYHKIQVSAGYHIIAAGGGIKVSDGRGRPNIPNILGPTFSPL